MGISHFLCSGVIAATSDCAKKTGDASVRADHWRVDTVSNDTHVALKIMFTAQGFVHFATRCLGYDRSHMPILSKKV